MKKTIVILLFTFSILNAIGQTKLQSGKSYFEINEFGDLWLENSERQSAGRALVPSFNDVLVINRGNDFAGGTQVGSQAHFYKNGVIIGQRISTTDRGEVDRLTVIPYFHTGGPWRLVSRDTNNEAFIDMRYGPQKNILTLQHRGNIGIGIANPTEKLEVNGTIRAKEVKIEATGWADFVFSADYKLPTLAEVKNHIQENKHLPNIPSEAEVKESGVDLGNMQIKLLQKIEELTLYVIELKEESIKQQTEMSQLRDELDNLTSKRL